MEGHVVTTNPWLVMAINMSIVFFVLIVLGVVMQIIYLLDPTRKKKEAPQSEVAPSVEEVVCVNEDKNEDEVVAAIVAAIVSMGYSSEQIASIRPTVSRAWKLDGRLKSRT